MGGRFQKSHDSDVDMEPALKMKYKVSSISYKKPSKRLGNRRTLLHRVDFASSQEFSDEEVQAIGSKKRNNILLTKGKHLARKM